MTQWMWHMTCATWHVTGGGGKHSLNIFTFLGLTVWSDGILNIFFQMMINSGNEWKKKLYSYTESVNQSLIKFFPNHCSDYLRCWQGSNGPM